MQHIELVLSNVIILSIFNPKRLFISKKNTLNEDGLATSHIVDFLKDESFIKSYSEAIKNNDFTDPGAISWKYRAYINKYFAEYVLKKLIPKENEKDLVDMPKKIIDEIKITPVEYADEVLKIALTKELKKTEWVEVDISKKDDKSQASIQ